MTEQDVNINAVLLCSAAMLASLAPPPHRLCDNTGQLLSDKLVFILMLFSPLISLQCEVGGPGAEERDHVSTPDHPAPDEEERDGLSAPEHQRWAQ